MGADLSRADLSNADLTGADLRAANLTGADLRGTDLRGTDLRGADLRGAYLGKANFQNSIRGNTKLKKRINLAGSLYNIEGFVFDSKYEEKLKEERKQRDSKAKEKYGEEKASIILELPGSISPAQLGWILIYVTALYEGVRLALTTVSFDSYDDLLRRAILPDLYGASKDENTIKLTSIKKGSWWVDLSTLAGISAVVLGFYTINDQKKKLQAETEAIKAERNTETIKTMINIIESPKVPVEIAAKASEILKQQMGELERHEERSKAAFHGFLFSKAKLVETFYTCEGRVVMKINDKTVFEKKV